MTLAPQDLSQLKDKTTEAAELLRQLSNPNRLLLLCHIAMGETSVGELEQELGLKQPGLSQQLAELRQAGLVKTRRQSRSIYYSIADAHVTSILAMLWQTFCASGDAPAALPFARPAASAEPSPATASSGAARFARILG